MPAPKVRFADPEEVAILIKQKLSELDKPLTQDEMARLVGLADPNLLMDRLKGGAGRRSWFEERLRRLGVSPKNFATWLVEIPDNPLTPAGRGDKKESDSFLSPPPRGYPAGIRGFLGYNPTSCQLLTLSRTGT